MATDKEVILNTLQRERDELHERIVQVDKIIKKVKGLEYGLVDEQDEILKIGSRPAKQQLIPANTFNDRAELAGVSLLRAKKSQTRISLSLHCENPELIRVFIARTKAAGLSGLRAYSESRPPLTERLSIYEAAVLATDTGCPVNLLHLSSRQAIESAIEVRRRHPEHDMVL